MKTGVSVTVVVVAAMLLAVFCRERSPRPDRPEERDWIAVPGNDAYRPGLTPEEVEFLRGEGISEVALAYEQRGEQGIQVRPFRIARRETSNDEYAAFLAAPEGASARLRPPADFQGIRPMPGTGRLPVRLVSLEDARAYAAFRRCRIPTEVEWEWAFRSRGHRLFPFANRPDPARVTSSDSGPRPVDAPRWDQGGVFHASGNVAEWTTSSLTPWAPIPPELRYPLIEAARAVARGGSYAGPIWDCRLTARRFVPTAAAIDIGIRLVRDS